MAYKITTSFLSKNTNTIPPLLMCLILAYEFWEAGTDKGHGNFKLPLLYLIMFVPLLFGGAGKWSMDYALMKLFGKR